MCRSRRLRSGEILYEKTDDDDVCGNLDDQYSDRIAASGDPAGIKSVRCYGGYFPSDHVFPYDQLYADLAVLVQPAVYIAGGGRCTGDDVYFTGIHVDLSDCIQLHFRKIYGHGSFWRMGCNGSGLDRTIYIHDNPLQRREMDAEESHLNVTVQPGGECLLMSKTAAGSRDKHVVRFYERRGLNDYV